MTSFKVLKAGPLTTIQDAGRHGCSHLGLTEGGPMDYRSFCIANALVGNDKHSAAIEVTLGGLTLECLQPSCIALTGAYCPLTINGKPKNLWQTHSLNKGDELQIGFAALGARAYLAMSGGINSDTWFHSQATVIRENLGRALNNGDCLETNECAPPVLRKLDFTDQPSLRKRATLQFVAGYQWDLIPPEAQETFLTESFQVSAQNNRMGCQLNGEPIHTGIRQLYSEGIAAGSIQITGAGKPIILTCDRQTIGGYPKLGAITRASQDTLAQLTPNSTLTFEIISPSQSIELLRSYYQRIEQLRLQNI